MIKKIVNYVKDPKLKIYYLPNNVNVINYDKILEIKSDVITLIKDKKVILIKGEDLKLTKLLDNEILITGKLEKIEL